MFSASLFCPRISKFIGLRNQLNHSQRASFHCAQLSTLYFFNGTVVLETQIKKRQKKKKKKSHIEKHTSQILLFNKVRLTITSRVLLFGVKFYSLKHIINRRVEKKKKRNSYKDPVQNFPSTPTLYEQQ